MKPTVHSYSKCTHKATIDGETEAVTCTYWRVQIGKEVVEDDFSSQSSAAQYAAIVWSHAGNERAMKQSLAHIEKKIKALRHEQRLVIQHARRRMKRINAVIKKATRK